MEFLKHTLFIRKKMLQTVWSFFGFGYRIPMKNMKVLFLYY